MFDYIQHQREVSIRVLQDNELYNSATCLCWSYIRDIIFKKLFQRNIQFKSTDQAVKEFMFLEYDKSVLNAVYSLYAISTLADWDNNFIVEKSNFERIINEFYLLKAYLEK